MSIDAWFVRIGQYLVEVSGKNLESEGVENLKNEKIAFKVVHSCL